MTMLRHTVLVPIIACLAAAVATADTPLPQWGQLDQSGQIAGAMVLVWVKLLVFLLPAYAFSYYFCAQTWIYLLLRRAADRIGLDYMDEPDDAPPAKAEAPNKVEDAA